MTSFDNKNYRISSPDVLRGFVIVVMALDHIRDYFGTTPFQPEDLTQTYPALFFTRWITHLCAPTFIFLAGTSAWLYGNKIQDTRKLSRFLFTRGLWFVLLEFLVGNTSMMFDWPWNKGFLLALVIWAIGISMIALSVLVYLPMRWIMGIGITMIVGHNLLDSISPEMLGSFGWLWKILHVGGSFIPLAANGSFGFVVAYPLIPWIGVMALGYSFGPVMRWESKRRQRFLWQVGLGLIVFFLALRATNFYGDLRDWAPQERGFTYSILSFLNVTKYPPSLLFLSITLGISALLLLLFERWKGVIPSFFENFGRVPFFFYLVHFPFVHLLSKMYFGWNTDFLFGSKDTIPPDYVPNLGLVYAVWVFVIAVMYFLCKWYGRYKFSHTQWWLKYL